MLGVFAAGTEGKRGPACGQHLYPWATVEAPNSSAAHLAPFSVPPMSGRVCVTDAGWRQAAGFWSLWVLLSPSWEPKSLTPKSHTPPCDHMAIGSKDCLSQ